MTLPLLTSAERAALESLATVGPERGLDPALRGRLALYKLVDETPEGWKITPLGRNVLAASGPPSEPRLPRSARDSADVRPTGERHYGRKARDTSWLE